MKKASLALAFVFASLLLVLLLPLRVGAQTVVVDEARRRDAAEVEKIFRAGNVLMGERKYAEALAKYKEGLALVPDDLSLLYNASTAALLIHDFASATGMLKKLTLARPEDWQARAKLIQSYQALGDLKARDAERDVLFDLRKRGKGDDAANPEMALSRQTFYCRERLRVGGREVMAFEHFELKGERALRYVFLVLDESGRGEDFRISLGSYDFTNSLWASGNKEKAAQGGRLFHLDGYFKWGHATYGMYHPEPSYDEVRKTVVAILEGKQSPISSSTRQQKPAEQQKP
jgi:tetratricopeptide (TPR) repeat protein